MRSPLLLRRLFPFSLGFSLCFSLVGCVSDTGIGSDGGAMDSGGSDVVTTMDSGGMDTGPVLADVDVSVIDGLSAVVQGVTVQIGAQTCTTNMMGKCTIKSVPPTYDVTIAYDSPGATKKRITIFQGLTTRTPTLEAIAAPQRQSNIALTLSGISFPTTGNDVVRILFAPTTHSSDMWFFSTAASVMANNWTWFGESPGKGKVTAYLVTLQNGLPTAWKAQSTAADYTMIDGQPLNQSIALQSQAIPTSSVGGTLNANGTQVNNLFVFVAPTGPGNGRILFGNLNAAAGNFTSTVLTASTINVAYGGVTNGKADWVWKANVAPGTNNLQLSVSSQLIALQAPAPMATGVDTSTMFSWTGPYPATFFHAFCGGMNPPYTYVYDVLTTKTSVQLQDTSGLGAPIPGGANCAWTAMSFANAMTPDDYAKPAGWTRFTSNLTFTQDGAMTQDGRFFTMK